MSNRWAFAVAAVGATVITLGAASACAVPATNAQAAAGGGQGAAGNPVLPWQTVSFDGVQAQAAVTNLSESAATMQIVFASGTSQVKSNADGTSQLSIGDSSLTQTSAAWSKDARGFWVWTISFKGHGLAPGGIDFWFGRPGHRPHCHWGHPGGGV